MSKINYILAKVHGKVHDLANKKLYSDPKIFTGGINISLWHTLSKSQQKTALNKPWYIYYSFRNPATGKLERQTNIKAGANNLKTKSERYKLLKEIQSGLLELLKDGYSPHQFNTTSKINTVIYAFEFGMNLKKGDMSGTSYRKFKSRIDGFERYLIQNGFKDRFITSVEKIDVVNYLNEVAKQSSNRNRNNTRIAISSLFSVLVNNELIPDNFVKKINVLKAPPKRNKTYSLELVESLYNYIEKNDPALMLFIKFVSYNFLRPIEVSRLTINDIDLNSKTLRVFVKQGVYKQKRIPDLLLKELPDLSGYKNTDILITPSGPGIWEAKEEYRRGFFGKRLSKIKKLPQFNLDADYNIYSFRHTFITRLYRSFRNDLTPFESKSKLMLITGHATMTALEKYLRDVDAEIPDDYSEHLK